VLISTTEHLLSALFGAGVDNAYVELDNLEAPILDGSAQPFVEMILRAGIKRQRRARQYMRILREVEVRDGDKSVIVRPSDRYSIHYNIDFPQPIGRSSIEVDMSNGGYLTEIAPARTFGFLEEVSKLQKMGLIRGASEDNAVVVTATGVKNPPLRFADEFVRHKVLDLIGDLALLGKQILGEVIADRAGHAMHTALVQKLLREPSLWELTPVDEDADLATAVCVDAVAAQD